MTSEPLYGLTAELFKSFGGVRRGSGFWESPAERDRTVGELLAAVGMESSNLSQHLGVLRRTGVVTASKERL